MLVRVAAYFKSVALPIWHLDTGGLRAEESMPGPRETFRKCLSCHRESTGVVVGFQDPGLHLTEKWGWHFVPDPSHDLG